MEGLWATSDFVNFFFFNTTLLWKLVGLLSVRMCPDLTLTMLLGFFLFLFPFVFYFRCPGRIFYKYQEVHVFCWKFGLGFHSSFFCFVVLTDKSLLQNSESSGAKHEWDYWPCWIGEHVKNFSLSPQIQISEFITLSADLVNRRGELEELEYRLAWVYRDRPYFTCLETGCENSLCAQV